MKNVIEEAWEQRASLNPGNAPKPLRAAVDEVIAGLDAGKLRVAEKSNGAWVTHQWLKKAVLLSFRMNDNAVVAGGPGGTAWFDKVGMRFKGMGEPEFKAAGFRAVPGCFVRESAYIAPRAVRTGMLTAQLKRYAELTGMSIDFPEIISEKIVTAIKQRKKDVYVGFPEKIFVRLNAIFPRLVDAAVAGADRNASTLFTA